MAFLDMAAELVGMLPGLAPQLAEKYINRALMDVYRKRDWSFLVTDGVLVCPAMITAGAASITQYSASVTLNTAASAAVQTQVLGTAAPGIQQLQIRFGSSTQLGGLYSIIAADNTTPTAVVLTLDRVVQEDTDAASAYQIYRAYVIPPIVNLRKWLSLEDFTNAIAIVGNRLTGVKPALDVRDPQRTSQGLAYWLYSWGANRISDPVTGATVPNSTQSAGTQIYELWPHPTQGQTFYCSLQSGGEPMVNPTDELPANCAIDDDLVILCALAKYAYPFAQANVGNFPGFKNVNWPTLILTATKSFNDAYLDAKRIDNSQSLRDVWNRGHGLRTGRPFGRFGEEPFVVDSNYLQSHLVRF